ncbi:MAG: hypothetical protein IJ088_06230 [Clostridia bacterium]|nr:hypothetical protein [Clostridia bacterium]
MQIIGLIVVLDNGKMIFSLAAVVLCVTDIALDLVNALILHGGTLGMGFVSSLSVMVQLLMLVAFFAEQRRRFTFFAESLSSQRDRQDCQRRFSDAGTESGGQPAGCHP